MDTEKDSDLLVKHLNTELSFCKCLYLTENDHYQKETVYFQMEISALQINQKVTDQLL